MKPMFLPEVEANPQPSALADLIRIAQGRGAEYPQIWHLFAFRPEATEHLGEFTQEIMRGECAAQPRHARADRGLHLAGNDCPF